MDDFYKTRMGQQFFDGTMQSIADSLKHLNVKMERFVAVIEKNKEDHGAYEAMVNELGQAKIALAREEMQRRSAELKIEDLEKRQCTPAQFIREVNESFTASMDEIAVRGLGAELQRLAWREDVPYDDMLHDLRSVIKRYGYGPKPKGPEIKQDRQLEDVIDEMVKHIPREWEDLADRLKDVRSSAQFGPPEGMQMWWKECRNILIEEIGEPNQPWQSTVAAIFSGEPIKATEQKGE